MVVVVFLNCLVLGMVGYMMFSVGLDDVMYFFIDGEVVFGVLFFLFFIFKFDMIFVMFVRCF